MHKYQIVAVLSMAAVCICAIAAYAFLYKKPVMVQTFEDCKNAGGTVMESYPERCTIDGATFKNARQTLSGDEYIGLSEADALKKAEEDKVAARVVERDGESLPVTMDFSYGRHNLHIKDGKVYLVEIEGEAQDR